MKRNIQPLVLISAIMILLQSCNSFGYRYNKGELPTTPVNLTEFNSEFDDYNSDAPTLGWLIPFCFSSNRNSSGAHFDVIYKPMNVIFDRESGVLDVKNEYGGWGIYAADFEKISSALERINTTSNELGPYFLYFANSTFNDFELLLMYATDEGGDFQINFTYNNDQSTFSEVQPIHFLNSEFNDLYPTFNKEYSKIYFCSDRLDGKFNIFSVDIDINDNNLIDDFISTESKEVIKNEILSSDFDDKCPYIFDNMMVFASNRPGGFGGYDLYYSRFEDGQWTAPTNFGASINSEYDEYRPILFDERVDYQKHMMVFSSNRPGGKGGFDLYFVGVVNGY